ncbi:30S ribosome-binding factor RbfA [Serpentinicella alkaliphila]|uniref:Ribosome-binding factor A n=1 Tax=Serpentinicella alkaliphila TaxID=1734049 RepID=A0A4R2U6T8_9FIRM|nr:30S ribosome-binding factor RbfA [Serpentinicella alkaliphila]QUH26327.1 30S ribosome-binding factor RbfA [Serpentinicella alkaliphila]TCQ05909.1 ribosome-binding factor A [Serpentinicella alkaliphila]
MAYPRVNRLNEEMKKYISHVVRNELKDPRVAMMTTITEVDVTRDLRYATVFVSVLGKQKEKEDTMEALKKSSGFIRREIGKRIKIRYIPEILFKLDESIEKSVDMFALIDKLKVNNSDQEVEKDGGDE